MTMTLAEWEHRIFGPPGCGKTTWLSRQVARATRADKTPMICSLTRTAAAEVAGRDLPIPPSYVGTLHSHCYQALGAQPIAEQKIHLEDWNETYPVFALSTGTSDRNVDEDNLDPTTGTEGDELMRAYQIHRARMDPQLPPRIAAFANTWTHWKHDNGLIDFTDMIEIALRDCDHAPTMPDVLFVDEAQDLDHLQMTLIRKWGKAAGQLIVVGDPDQNIYRWRGSDPTAFTEPAIAPSNEHTLAQSYRVPRKVHEQAVAWINNVANRRPVVYRPRDADGDCHHSTATFLYPEPALDDAMEHLSDGKTVMFLTTCSYMLDNIITLLRKEGIPFHNPHRRSNGAWNPFQKRRNQTTAADRLLAFLHMSEEGYWAPDHIQHWTDAVHVAGVLPRKGRQLIKDLKDLPDRGPLLWDTIHTLLTPEAVDAGLSGDLDWYEEHLLTSRKGPSSFPLNVVRRRGPDTLKATPQVVVGTIHSVKGSEADVVYLFPDMSRPGMQEWLGNDDTQSAVYRLFYVGMTRARETLVLCRRSHQPRRRLLTAKAHNDRRTENGPKPNTRPRSQSAQQPRTTGDYPRPPRPPPQHGLRRTGGPLRRGPPISPGKPPPARLDFRQSNRPLPPAPMLRSPRPLPEMQVLYLSLHRRYMP